MALVRFSRMYAEDENTRIVRQSSSLSRPRTVPAIDPHMLVTLLKRPRSFSPLHNRFLSDHGWQERVLDVVTYRPSYAATRNFHRARRYHMRTQLNSLLQWNAPDENGAGLPLQPAWMRDDYTVLHCGSWADGFDVRSLVNAKSKRPGTWIKKDVGGKELAPKGQDVNTSLLPHAGNPVGLGNDVPPGITDVEVRLHSPVPDLVSDHTSPVNPMTEDQELAITDNLKELACRVLQFWQAGIAIYLAHPQNPNQDLSFGNNNIPSSKQPSKQNEHGQSGNQKDRLTTCDESVGEDMTPTVQVKHREAGGSDVIVFRCLVEAVAGDHSCDKSRCELFESMLRHIKIKHPWILEAQYVGRSFEQLVRDVRRYLRKSNDEAGEELSEERLSATLYTFMHPGHPVPYLQFIRRSRDNRECMPPPLPYDVPLAIPSVRGLVNQAPEAFEVPPVLVTSAAQVASSHLMRDIYDSSTIQPPAQSLISSESQTAVHNFAATMKANPLFALKVQMVYDELDMHREDAKEEREMIDLEINRKRKEFEADEQHNPEADVKRARYRVFRNESRTRKRQIAEEMLERQHEAIRKMEQLHEGVTDEQMMMPPPSKNNLPASAELIESTPQPLIMSNDGYGTNLGPLFSDDSSGTIQNFAYFPPWS